MIRFAAALLLALVAPVAPGQDGRLPAFDADLHYNDDAQAPYPVAEVLARLRDAGVTTILATSRPNDGTKALRVGAARAGAGAPRVVPFIRPYRNCADRGTWFNDPEIFALIEAALARPVDWRGIGEFHVFGSDADTPWMRKIALSRALRRRLGYLGQRAVGAVRGDHGVLPRLARGASPGCRVRHRAPKRRAPVRPRPVTRALRPAAAIAGIVLVLIACGGAPTATAATTPASAFDRGRLFRIDRAGVPPSYVYGTLHSNDPRVVELPPAVAAALASSRSAAFETLLLERDVATFVALAQYEDGRRLTDHVDAATLETIRAALGPGAPDPPTLERAKPWAVFLMLAQSREGGTTSLDGVLQAEARARRLAVLGLELPDEQVASLDAIPLASQLALMHWALRTQHARWAELEATTRAWLAGDLAGLRRLSLAPGRRDAELATHLRTLVKHLITDRNILMAHRLHLPLARGRVFVAVGALHLQGRDGLLALIRRQGYRVTRVL